MTRTVHGKIHGKTIELDEDPGLAEGQDVEIILKGARVQASVQDRTSEHLRHYLHSTLGGSWLTDAAPGVSALLNLA